MWALPVLRAWVWARCCITWLIRSERLWPNADELTSTQAPTRTKAVGLMAMISALGDRRLGEYLPVKPGLTSSIFAGGKNP